MTAEELIKLKVEALGEKGGIVSNKECFMELNPGIKKIGETKDLCFYVTDESDLKNECFVALNENSFSSEIEIPKNYEKYTVTEILNFGFLGSSVVQKLIIPKTLKKIGESAFWESSLTEIVFEGSLNEWEAIEKKNDWYNKSIHSFVYCKADCKEIELEYEIASDCYNYYWRELNEKEVAICYGDFGKECEILFVDGFTSFGKLVPTVEYFPFTKNKNVVKKIIFSGVKNIANRAFFNYVNLEDVKLYGVRYIERAAFSFCPKIKEIIITETVEKIKENPFSDCKGLETITCEKNNEFYDSRDNCNAVIETKTNKLVIGCKNTIIPNSVTCIGKDAFSGSSLKEIKLPNSLKKISPGAFRYCSLLEKIVFEGTIDEWNNISKCKDWNKKVPAKVVNCVDGIIEI